MSTELVAIIGITGWAAFWIYYRLSQFLVKAVKQAHEGWRKSIEENGKVLSICKMQQRLLDAKNDDGEAWKNK